MVKQQQPQPQPNSANIKHDSFPQVLADIPWGLPVEVTLVGTLSKGEGDAFLKTAAQQQKAHPTFVDEYNEQSAKIGNLDLSKDDPTTIYSFLVGKQDLVFHRHEGHRVIMGITGSAGAALKFSSCTAQEAHETPEKFLEKMFVVIVPGDSVFVLRFSGEVYHQFGTCHPKKNGFFAISVHTNEIKGLSGELLETVIAGNGSIPLLTEPIPEQVAELLEQPDILKNVPIYTLSQQLKNISASLTIEELFKPFLSMNKIPLQGSQHRKNANWEEWYKIYVVSKYSRLIANKSMKAQKNLTHK